MSSLSLIYHLWLLFPKAKPESPVTYKLVRSSRPYDNPTTRVLEKLPAVLILVSVPELRSMELRARKDGFLVVPMATNSIDSFDSLANRVGMQTLYRGSL